MKITSLLFSMCCICGCVHRGSYGPISQANRFDTDSGGCIVVATGYAGYPGLFNDRLNDNAGGWIKVVRVDMMGTVTQKQIVISDKESGFHPRVKYIKIDGSDVVEIFYRNNAGKEQTIRIIME